MEQNGDSDQAPDIGVPPWSPLSLQAGATPAFGEKGSVKHVLLR